MSTTSIFNFPSVFDRADGVDGRLGTAAPAGAIKINSVAGVGNVFRFEEYPDSPTIENGDQNTITHRFHGDYNTIQTTFLTSPRGTIQTDSQGNISRILNTSMFPVSKTLDAANGQTGEWNLTVVAECISFGHPPDEFSVEVVELNPALEKHPRYGALTYLERRQIHNANVVDSPDLAQVYKNTLANFPTNPVQALNEFGQGYELLYKKQKGEDSFYLAGYKLTWSQYFWYPQVLNPGGYIEDPISQGGLPSGFWSTNGLPNGTNIFANTTNFNQNLYPQNGTQPIGPQQATFPLTWLRQADQFVLNRTWFKLTRSWLGAPLSQWDQQLYSPTLQPLITSGSVNANA